MNALVDLARDMKGAKAGAAYEPAGSALASSGRAPSRDGTWLDEHMRLSGPEGAKLLSLVLRFVNRTPKRRDHKEWYERRVECVLANALRVHFFRVSDAVAYRSGNNDYKAGPKWLCGSGLRDTIKDLANAGLIETTAGKWGGGGPWRSDGRAATYSIDRRLRSMISFCKVTANAIDKLHPPISGLIKLRPAKDEGNALIDFNQTEETRSWAADLDKYNHFVEQHEIWVDLGIKAEKSLLKWWNKKLAEHSHQPALSYPEYFDRHLHRIFNDGTFDRGGRLYGPWYQYAPKWIRGRIWIDDSATTELDYSGMSLRMIYHDRGFEYLEDPYEIPKLTTYGIQLGRGPTHFRDAIKKLVQAMLNNEDDDVCPEMIGLDQSFRPKYTRAQVRDMILAKHDAISNVFGTGVGKALQRYDSDIAFDVIISLMDEGILCLPIHDSFIVAKEHKARLHQQMITSYQSSFDYDPIISDD
jgi:hypothetical protein